MARFIPFSLCVMAAILRADALADPSPHDLLAQGKTTLALIAVRGSQSAEAHNLACRAYYAEAKYDSAIPECEKAVHLQPNRSEYHLWLGRAYGEKADASSFIIAAALSKRVKSEFEKAVTLEPGNIDARADLGEFYVEAPGFLGGGTDKARAQAVEIGKRDPARANWLRGRIAEKIKDTNAAEREYLNAVKAASNPAVPWINAASFYRRRSQISKMEEAIIKAIAADQKNTSVLFDAATLLLRAGRNFNLAIQLLERYLSSDSKSEDAPAFRAYTLLATLLERQGQKTEAGNAYRSALALGDYAPAREGLARIHSSLSRS